MTKNDAFEPNWSRLSILLTTKLPPYENKRSYDRLAKKMGVGDGIDLLMISRGKHLLPFHCVHNVSRELSIDPADIILLMAEQDWSDDGAMVDALRARMVFPYERPMLAELRSWAGDDNLQYGVDPSGDFVIRRVRTPKPSH